MKTPMDKTDVEDLRMGVLLIGLWAGLWLAAGRLVVPLWCGVPVFFWCQLVLTLAAIALGIRKVTRQPDRRENMSEERS